MDKGILRLLAGVFAVFLLVVGVNSIRVHRRFSFVAENRASLRDSASVVQALGSPNDIETTVKDGRYQGATLTYSIQPYLTNRCIFQLDAAGKVVEVQTSTNWREY